MVTWGRTAGAPPLRGGADAKRPASGGGTRSGRTRLGGGAAASPSGETQCTQTLSSGYDPADSPKLPRQEARNQVSLCRTAVADPRCCLRSESCPTAKPNVTGAPSRSDGAAAQAAGVGRGAPAAVLFEGLAPKPSRRGTTPPIHPSSPARRHVTWFRCAELR